MSKPPRAPGEPEPAVEPGPDTGATPADPRSRLTAAIADTMARWSARTGAGEADPNAELLAQWAIVKEMNVDPDDAINVAAWTRAVVRASTTRPLTLAGLRAKVDFAFMVVGLEPEPGEEDTNLDRFVLWFTLADVLAIIDDAQN